MSSPARKVWLPAMPWEITAPKMAENVCRGMPNGPSRKAVPWGTGGMAG